MLQTTGHVSKKYDHLSGGSEQPVGLGNALVLSLKVGYHSGCIRYAILNGGLGISL